MYSTLIGHTCTYHRCQKVLVVDGNMKNRCDVCMARDAGYTKYEGIPGSIKTGCMNSPEQTSRFCKVHQIRMCNPCPVVDTDEAAPSVSRSQDGIVESIIEKRATRKPTYYKVTIYVHLYMPLVLKY